MSEVSAVNVSTRKQSVKGYASRVLKQSSVNAVSAIVSTSSIPRKIFFVLMFLLFTTGFLYQCIKFLAYVLTYPTVITVEITKPDLYIAPAYTFCNNNKIKRSKFCAEFPDFCVSPNIEFCNKYPIPCKDNDTKIVKKEYYNLYFELKPVQILKLGHDMKDLLSTHERMLETPEGPFIRFREDDDLYGHFTCFSYQGRVDNSLDPRVQPRRSPLAPTKQEFIFNSEPAEVFSPFSKVGVFFAIHSQFDGVNPFKKGIFLKPGHRYQITVRMQEERLLKHPYITDCVNYTEIWLNNNKRGPRSQNMCLEKCTADIFVTCSNCTIPELNYPSDSEFCDNDMPPLCVYTKELLMVYKECVKGCKDECLKMKYEYQVQEREVDSMLLTVNEEQFQKESHYIRVYIEFEDAEIYSFEYKAQYQEVEVFSYIGGFIGIWLGVSLVQVADFFESAFRIIRYFFKKRPVRCSKV